MSFNIQLNTHEINQIIIINIMKLLERRKLLDSWQATYDKFKNETQTTIDITLNNNKKCSIYIINAKLTTIVSKTPLDIYLSNNIDVHKFIIIQEALKKVVKQIIYEYENAEYFSESEMLEDIPSKDFIPHHEIIGDEERKELLSKYQDTELSRILITDIMCRYYGGKIGDIFKITRPSFTAGYSIVYRRVVQGSLDIMF
jgi:DNA-directed RNA polymerase subunit H (RpoH/RPB5)